ncbi:MAG: dioxygenase [Gammaproteobacteria bacterium]|nr:dioxygenase [Gammaproteobacteria bacterium]MCP5135596.1 dioxygenase [Gammaproteobacteria bacterium]
MNPVLFISHGAPNIVLRDTPHGEFLRDLGRSLPRPQSVIVLSAHWSAPNPIVGSAPRPTTIHDFSGFPPELSSRRYDAPGDSQLAVRLCDHLRKSGMSAECDPQRGLDHGVWTTLSLMYPEADVRVVPVALPVHWPPSRLMQFGQVLGEARTAKVMIVATGGLVHNLSALSKPGASPEAWASGFAEWMIDTVTQDRRERVDDYRNQALFAERAHPTDEHLLPLFVAWGAARAGGEVLHEGFDYGNLGMHAFAFWD